VTGGAASAGPVRQTLQRSSEAPAVHFAPASRGWSRSAPPVSQTTATDYLRPSRGWARTDHWGGSDASPELVRALRGGAAGRPLPADVDRQFGPPLGADFGNVRIHTDGTADRLARSIQSRAFTHGSDVYFSNGAYDPGSRRGRWLLAHELAHVAQHRSGPSTGTVIGRANDPAERAADRAADNVVGALHGGSAPIVGAPRQADLSTPSVNTDHTVRRMFGLEFELPIPVFRKESRGGSAVPKPAKATPKTDSKGNPIHSVQLAEGDGFDVHSDHSSALNPMVPQSAQGYMGYDPEKGVPVFMATILELATTPLDESKVTEAGVRRHLNKAADFAKEAMRRSRRSNVFGNWRTPLYTPNTLLDKLPNIKNATPPNTNYIGPAFEPNNINKAAVGVMSDRAYTQATQGFSLKSLQRHFLDQAGDTSRIQDPRKKAMRESVDLGSKAAKWLMPKWKYPFGHGNARRELQGYLTAIAYYLRASAVAGSEGFVGVLGKNMIGPFFFKTGLHTVRNQLQEKYPEVRDLLATPSQRAALGNKLLQLTKRKSNETFFPNDPSFFECGEWLQEVLAGTGDRALEDFKNPWSNELTAPSIGSGKHAGVGLVIENRRLAETLGMVGKKYSPDEWPDLALRIYYQHQLLSGDDAGRRLATARLRPRAASAPSAPPPGGTGMPTGTEIPGIPPAPPPPP